MKNNKKRMVDSMIINYGNVRASCKQAQISRAVHYRWLNNCIEYKEAINNVTHYKREFIESAEHDLIEKEMRSMCYKEKRKTKLSLAFINTLRSKQDEK